MNNEQKDIEQIFPSLNLETLQTHQISSIDFILNNPELDCTEVLTKYQNTKKFYRNTTFIFASILCGILVFGGGFYAISKGIESQVKETIVLQSKPSFTTTDRRNIDDSDTLSILGIIDQYRENSIFDLSYQHNPSSDPTKVLILSFNMHQRKETGFFESLDSLKNSPELTWSSDIIRSRNSPSGIRTLRRYYFTFKY